MRVFVAGGTGALGRRIVPGLLDRGHQVTVLARTPARAQALRARGALVVAGDVLDRDRTITAVADASPDLVMHQLTDLAGGSLTANARLRITGTRNLVDATLAAKVSRLVVQSIAWCYEPGDTPADENTPLDTRSTDPGRRASVDAVIAMEKCAREIPAYVILRNGMFYGPDTWYRADGDVGAAVRARRIPAGPDVTSFVHIDDAATAAVCALDWPTAAINIVDDEPATGETWLPAFCTAVGAPPPPPSNADRQPWARGAANHHARNLGWSPRWPSWRTGFTSAPRQ
jgi:nucleoside-diphosphate-sugar epimerase